MLRWIPKTERALRAALAQARRTQRAAWGKTAQPSTVAIVLCDTPQDTRSTIDHLAQLAFDHIVVFAPTRPDGLRQSDLWVPAILPDLAHHCAAVNAVLASVPRGTWVHSCYPNERLYYPKHETRSLRDLIRFTQSAERLSIQGVVVDCYAHDGHLMADRGTYHAEPRQLHRSAIDTSPKVKRFYGGLRSRFAAHVSSDSLRIDRAALIQSHPRHFLLPSGQFSRPALHSFANHRGPAPVATILSQRAEWILTHNYAVASSADLLCESSHKINPATDALIEAGLMSRGCWI